MEEQLKTCPFCKGTGEVDEPLDLMRCDPPSKVICVHCEGTGKIKE